MTATITLPTCGTSSSGRCSSRNSHAWLECSPIAADYTYTRDKLGRITIAARTHVGLSSIVTMTHAWDDLGRRTTMEADIGATNDFRNTYKYDGLSRLKRLDQDKQGSGGGYNAVAEKRVDLVYNQLGRLTSVARYKDLDGGTTHEVSTSTYGYDAEARFAALTHKKGTTTQEGFTWSFDALDRVTQVVSTVDGTSTYKYDATDQLITADHDATLNPQTADESYVNDLGGNRRASGTTNWKADTDNRLLRDGTYEYTYDKESNRTKRVTLVSGNPTGATTEYAWDHRNRLTTVTEKTAPTGGTTTKIVTYEYDAFDRRIAKSVDNTPIGSINRYEFYVWSGDDVIFDFVDADGGASPSATLSKRYLWGDAVDQLFAQEDVSTGVLWTLGDNLGTTRDVVDNTGAVISHYKYDAFGKVTSGDTTKTRFLYTSQEYDPDTGLVYYNARWYDPQAARFISYDSWGFVAGDANLSRYVENSPTNYTDPTGHAPIDTGVLVPSDLEAGAPPDEPPNIGVTGVTGLEPPNPLSPPQSTLPLLDYSKEEMERRKHTIIAVVPISPGNFDLYQKFKAAKSMDEKQAIMLEMAEAHKRYEDSLEFQQLTAGRSSWECGFLWEKFKDIFRVDFGYTLLVLYDDGHEAIIPAADASTGDYAEAFTAWLGIGAAAKNGVGELGKEVADEVVDTVAGQAGVPVVPRKKRPGSKGHPDHQRKVDELECKAREEAGPGESVVREKRVRGVDSRRIPDVQILDKDGKTRKVFEAERKPNSKRNREREAEYNKLGIDNETYPLDEQI